MPLPGSYSAVPEDDSDDDTYNYDALLPAPVTASSGTNNTYPPSSPSGRVASLGANSKGKGKAVEHATANGQADLSANGRSGDSSAGSPTGPAGMSFSVRFTDGSQDLLDIWVGERESVGQVKRRVSLRDPGDQLGQARLHTVSCRVKTDYVPCHCRFANCGNH